MAQLIQLRQRIKAIQTIQKITHAMRLIAMSSHSRLKQRQATFETFKNHIAQLLSIAQKAAHTTAPASQILPEGTKELVILVGSQKGLCGNFNNQLFQFFRQHQASYHNSDIIIIGYKAIQYAQYNLTLPVIKTYSSFGIKDVPSIAASLVQLLLEQQTYSRAVMISMIPKTFFTQRPQETTIWPYHQSTTNPNDNNDDEQEIDIDLVIEPDAATLVQELTRFQLTSELESVLFQSLLAEQASRFISMDNATRNAAGLLDATKLSYNKLRQAKITQELTELAASF